MDTDDWDSENYENFWEKGSPHTEEELEEQRKQEALSNWRDQPPALDQHGYTEDWGQVSSRTRMNRGYKCQQCGVVLKDNLRLLHVHHINGDKTDNAPVNLLVLCVLCHSEQTGHSHLLEGLLQNDLKVIAAKRREL